ncbi:MAG: A/G-specific adenine glycosylase [Parcubacteria group bacterium Gr01-1014_70]|nr:MAG: A/G-specific adenine glycosylase [Parcubacteria group bacterium Gr01-1014_70]
MNTRKRQSPATLQSRKRKNPETRYVKLRLDKAFVTGFQKRVWEWHQNHASLMPWRKTRNPYHIFVSEVMLQQTQIPRVLVKYQLFLTEFPTVSALSKAPLRRVLSVWQGMGYNRRALYLKQAAEIIVKKHAGKVPYNETDLDALPGIGPYSARAIACFAYGICEPFIETNIRRAVIHEFFPRKTNVTDKKILQLLQHVQPSRRQRAWYWALMDYGREALKGVPNANRNSKHYAKQSKFEGSPRYIRAKIISYLLENKKATGKELHTSLKNDKYLSKLSQQAVKNALVGLTKEKLVGRSGLFFWIA